MERIGGEKPPANETYGGLCNKQPYRQHDTAEDEGKVVIFHPLVTHDWRQAPYFAEWLSGAQAGLIWEYCCR